MLNWTHFDRVICKPRWFNNKRWEGWRPRRRWTTGSSQRARWNSLQLQPLSRRLLFGFHVHHDDAHRMAQVFPFHYGPVPSTSTFCFSLGRSRQRCRVSIKIGRQFGLKWGRPGLVSSSTSSPYPCAGSDGTIELAVAITVHLHSPTRNVFRRGRFTSEKRWLNYIPPSSTS